MTLAFILPFILFITNAAIGCFSNSPIISIDLPFLTAYSNTVCIFLTDAIGELTNKTKGFSSVTVCLPVSVTKFALANP